MCNSVDKDMAAIQQDISIPRRQTATLSVVLLTGALAVFPWRPTWEVTVNSETHSAPPLEPLHIISIQKHLC
jgi:hypothetical protein